MSPVHHLAQTGFGKGTNELYDRARPTYPTPALAAIRGTLSKLPPFNVLEVGSGTGIFTRALLSDLEWSSAVKELRAVEPSEGMRAQFSEKVMDNRVSVREGTFEETHVPDGWADLIVIAQAFHWCPDYDKAMQEFNRALSPDGRLVFIWNLEDSSTAWIGQLRSVIERYEQGSPQYRLGLWRQAFQTPSYVQFFKPPEEIVFHHSVTGNFSAVIDRAFSKSYVAIASEADKSLIRKQLSEILERGDGKVWIDKEEGTFEYPYDTTVVIMRKKL